ncbi:MAG: fibronectin type III domain-containing protein [Bacteroidales bacterium]|nr:fibronectin type III domain-containing protein [Bacteroidales bacterium]
MKYFIIGSMIMLMSITAYAQQSNSSFRVFSKYQNGQVYLKIQPIETQAWYEARQKGYVIERKELNGEEPFQVISSSPLVPYSQERMRQLAQEDPYTGELMTVLYDMEQMENPDEMNFPQLEERANNLTGTIFLHFYLSCMSPTSSEASGLQFTDIEAQANRQYQYRVRIKGEEENSASARVNTFRETSQSLPMVNLRGLDKAVQINWYHKDYREVYIGYRIEKSADRNNWGYLGEAPIIYNKRVSSESEDLEPGYIYEGDSLERNYKPYYYRLTGIDFFGHRMGPGQVFEVRGRDLQAPGQPRQVELAHQDNGSMELSWDYPVNQTPDLAGFFIGRGPEPEGPFKQVNRNMLPPKSRSYQLDQPTEPGITYYVVTALDTAGNYKNSLTVYESVPDNTPPATPDRLTGSIDTSGVVTLTWPRGEENDLMGYRLYRSNQPDHEYVQITHAPLADTILRDTITLRTLTKEVFYKIVAVDNNYNHSPFSAPEKVIRPDVVPPVPPRIRSVSLNNNTVSVKWAASSSRDVEENILLRQDGDEWMQAGTFTDQTSFREPLPADRQQIVYAMVARDKSGLYSDTSDTRSVRSIKFYKLETAAGIEARYNQEEKRVQIKWDGPGGDNIFYIIYRGTPEKGLRMYQTADNGKSSFSDNRLVPGREYQYAIRVKRADGKTSPLSDRVTVQVNNP